MRFADLVQFTFLSMHTQRLRSGLTALGIAVGIAAVVLLTSIGEGVHRFVLAEFTQFGSNLIGINPGKATTHGASVGVFGTTRPLTLEDSEALSRLPEVKAAVPLLQGNAEVRGAGRSRRTTVYGVGPDMPEVFQLPVSVGRFLPRDTLSTPRAFAVLGSRMKQELFGSDNALGQRIRVGGSRFQVIGVMASKGQILGFDLDDTVYIPAARALALFNRDSLMEIDVLYHTGASETGVVAALKRLLEARHGRDDVTVTTQAQMLEVLGGILDVLTLAVGALGGISLLVGGIGILTIMTISVTNRTAEIGLLRALGASHPQVLLIFLSEAVLLSAAGGLLGLLIGVGGAGLLKLAVPAMPVQPSWQHAALALLLASLVGLLAGVLPARSAAGLDPVEALRAE